MKKTYNLNQPLLYLSLIICFAACTKKDTPNTTKSSSSTTTTPTYYVSYTDTTAKTYEANQEILIDITLWPINSIATASVSFNLANSTTDYVNSRTFTIYLPIDSSDIKSVPLNVKSKIYGYALYTGTSLPDSTIGNLCITMTTSSGTDSTIYENQTSTYYNEITSINYVGRSYDTYNKIENANFVITGQFNTLVKNNVTHLTRPITNGKYSFLFGCRCQ